MGDEFDAVSETREVKGNPPIQAEEELVKGYPITCEALPRQKLSGSTQSPGGSAGPSGLRREQTGTGRAETGPATFLDPGGRSREAQRSGSTPWKRSFCSSRSDRNGTVSCRGHRHRALSVRGVVERNWSAAMLWSSPGREGAEETKLLRAWCVGADGRAIPRWRRKWFVRPTEGSVQAGGRHGPLDRWKGVRQPRSPGFGRWLGF